MKGLSFINPKYIHEGEFDSISAPEKSTHSHRKLAVLILAACLVFSLAVAAYAANLFGIRELFRTPYRELPETAVAYIQQETAAATSILWRPQTQILINPLASLGLPESKP